MDPWKMMDFFQFLLDVGCEAMWSNLKDKGTDEKNKNKKTCHLWHVSCYTFERLTSFSPSCRLIAWRFHTLPRATERLSVNKGGQCHKGHLFVTNRSQINKWNIRWSWNTLKHSLQIVASNTVIPNEATKTCQPWYFMTFFSKLRPDGHTKTAPSRLFVSDHDSLGSSLHPCWTDIFGLGLNPAVWNVLFLCRFSLKILETLKLHMKFLNCVCWHCEICEHVLIFACCHLTQYSVPCKESLRDDLTMHAKIGKRKLEMLPDGHGTSPSQSPIGRGTYQPYK